jgi:DNA polymerase V
MDRSKRPAAASKETGLACSLDCAIGVAGAFPSRMEATVTARAYDGGSTTGFASPASDSIEGPVDLSGVLDLRRPSRYPVRLRGQGLASRGILEGDVLIADTAASLRHGAVALAAIEGEMRACILECRKGTWCLLPGGEDGFVTEVGEVDVWAIVTGVVRENP